MGTGRFYVSPEMAAAICQGVMPGPPRYFEVVENPLPDDARVVGVGVSSEVGWNVKITIESDSIEGEDVELPRPMIRASYAPGMDLNAPRPGRVERYTGNGQQPYYFRIKAANGETLVHSEGYSSPEAREKGIAALRNAALNGEGWEVEI